MGQPLGPQHAAPGGLRTGTAARPGLPAGSGPAPGAVLPRLRRRRAAVQLGRPDRRLSLAPVRPAAGPGDRGIHQGRAARPGLGAAAPVARGDRAPGQRAAELHWSYDGDYWFLSNNCAVETLKLLRSGTGRSELQDLDSIMPNGLLDLLEGRALADRSVLDDPREALRLGYRFDSFRERYQAMFEILAQPPAPTAAAVEDWLALPAADARAPGSPRADLRASAALLLLEQAALRRQLLLAQDELKQRHLGARDDPQDAALRRSRRHPRAILAGQRLPQPPGRAARRRLRPAAGAASGSDLEAASRRTPAAPAPAQRRPRPGGARPAGTHAAGRDRGRRGQPGAARPAPARAAQSRRRPATCPERGQGRSSSSSGSSGSSCSQGRRLPDPDMPVGRRLLRVIQAGHRDVQAVRAERGEQRQVTAAVRAEIAQAAGRGGVGGGAALGPAEVRQRQGQPGGDDAAGGAPADRAMAVGDIPQWRR